MVDPPQSLGHGEICESSCTTRKAAFPSLRPLVSIRGRIVILSSASTSLVAMSQNVHSLSRRVPSVLSSATGSLVLNELRSGGPMNGTRSAAAKSSVADFESCGHDDKQTLLIEHKKPNGRWRILLRFSKRRVTCGQWYLVSRCNRIRQHW